MWLTTFGWAQESMNLLLKTLNTESVPYIKAKELAANLENYVILDARTIKEFEVSRLKNAHFIGSKGISSKKIKTIIPNPDTPVVVYCTLGVRSEDVAEKLVKIGFSNVYNLYGGIIEWKNQSYPIYNNQNKPTDSVHTYSWFWGLYLKNGHKIYDR